MTNITLSKSKMMSVRQKLLEIHQKISWDKQWPPRNTILLQDCPGAQKVFDAEELIIPEGKLIMRNSEKVLPEKKLDCPAAWVARIPNGASVGGTYLNKDVQAIISSWDAWNHYGCPNNWLVPISRRNQIQGSCLDLGKVMYANNYYHFLIEQVTQFAMLKAMGMEPDWILIPKKHGKFVDDICQQILGLDKNKIIYTSPTELTTAPEVLPCTPPTHQIAKHESWGIEFLNKIFEPHKKSENKKIRLFIDRSGGEIRRIKNQDQIEHILDKLGFSKVRLEEKSLPEQVNYFHNAEVIISPHGAGLANLAFCQPGTKVVEIFSPQYMVMCYRQLAARANLQWLGIVGEGDISDEKIKRNILNRRPSLKNDITVDLKVLEKALEWALSK